MNDAVDFFLLLVSQFSGGPGAPENNLVRFGLAAAFWGVLLVVAWTRQRQAELPRERLLVVGFGLGFCRELFMMGHASLRLINPNDFQAACRLVEPIEHALSLGTMVFIAGSFLRYILDDASLARRFLQVGTALTGAGYLLTLLIWPKQLDSSPDLRFHDSWEASLLHLLASALLAVAIGILVTKGGWLRNVVISAFALFFLSEFLVLIGLTIVPGYNHVLCPIANALYIWGIPLFGYVYFREQGIEKRQAEEALHAYRDQLEELVMDRTAELTEANRRLEKAAVLEARQRVAADMHDGLAQTLSYLGLKLDGAVELLEHGEVSPMAGEFNQMRRAVEQATREVRRSIASLRQSPRPRVSLQDALATMIVDHTGPNSPGIELHSELEQPLFLPDVEMEQVKQVVQEAVRNAYRHAQAGQIEIVLRQQGDTVQIQVSDDGEGFDLESADKPDGDHFGLSIMQARASRIGGALSIRSERAQGTDLILTWQPGRSGEQLGPAAVPDGSETPRRRPPRVVYSTQ